MQFVDFRYRVSRNFLQKAGKKERFQFKPTRARVVEHEHTDGRVALNDVYTYTKVARHGHVHPAIRSTDREINYNKFNGNESARREGVALFCMYTCT